LYGAPGIQRGREWKEDGHGRRTPSVAEHQVSLCNEVTIQAIITQQVIRL
jgi:hypothetical protein